MPEPTNIEAVLAERDWWLRVGTIIDGELSGWSGYERATFSNGRYGYCEMPGWAGRALLDKVDDKEADDDF